MQRAAGHTWVGKRLRNVVAEGGSFPINDPRAAAALALLWAGTAVGSAATAAAANLYSRVIDHVGVENLSEEHQLAAAQSYFLCERFDDAAEAVDTFDKLPDVSVHYLRADLLSPTTTRSAPTSAWLELLSAQHRAAGIEPLELLEPASEAEDLFDALDCSAGDATGGELVSVVMPCHKPDAGLITSLRSLLRQTWQDLEIVVVDDGSGPGFDEWFDRAAAMDPRVRIIRLEVNGGAYRARNIGIGAARGTILTFQDADDWSHPRRVELQVSRLRESAASATRSAAIRARPDLTHQWFGYPPVRLNVSSLMLRRDTLRKFGLFYELRKGSDSEYESRIGALGGVIADVPVPLAVTRLRPGSLSRGDFSYQWATPDRLDFRGNFDAWHRTLGHGQHVGLDPARPPFATPTRFTAIDGGHLDVVFAADYSARAANPQVLPRVEDIDDLGRRGLRQALWHLEDIRVLRKGRPVMDPDWRDLIQSREHLHSVCRTDAVRVDRLVVCSASVLLINGDQDTSVEVRDIEVWLTPADLTPSVSGLPLDLLWISDRCRDWWSVRPRWVASPYLTAEEKAELVVLAGTLRLDESLMSRDGGIAAS